MLSGSQMAGALPALLSCGLAVLFRMLPCGVVLVLRGFQIMTECDPGMMRGLLMIAGFVMLWRPRDDIWQRVHSAALPVRDARES